MQVVVQVGAGADDEVDEPSFHQFNDASAEAGGGERAGERQSNRRVVLLGEHLVAKNAAGFAQPGGIERLKSLVDQGANRRTALRAVVADRLASEK